MSVSRKIARTYPTNSGDITRNPGIGLPQELLDKAVERLCAVSLISAISAVAFYIAHGLLQPEMAQIQQHPLMRLLAVATVLLGLGFFGLQRAGWVSKQTVIYLGIAFQGLVAYAIAVSETARIDSPKDPVVGVSAVAVWLVLCGMLIPSTPLGNLLGSTLSVLGWIAGYWTSQIVFHHPFIGWNRMVMWMLPLIIGAIWTNVASRRMYSMAVQSHRAEELGSYRLERIIGQGGMGEVWLASHRVLARQAAVKLIRPEVLSGQSMQAEEVIRKRFEREARATATLRNPHTVALWDFGSTQDGVFYYVMELLEGADLQTLVERFGPMHPGRVRNVLIQVCESLEEAHRLGMVHRDIKPRNIFLCKLGWQHDFSKVLDFGLVKTLMQGDDTLMTAAGAATGTPAYMSPEVALGARDIDGRSDIYGLGCVAYFMLTGQLVFTEGNSTAMALAHVQKEPVAPSQRTELPIPAGLERIILQCLAKDPEDRPKTVRELARRLEALHDTPAFCRDMAASWWETNLPDAAAERELVAAGSAQGFSSGGVLQ